MPFGESENRMPCSAARPSNPARTLELFDSKTELEPSDANTELEPLDSRKEWLKERGASRAMTSLMWGSSLVQMNLDPYSLTGVGPRLIRALTKVDYCRNPGGCR